MGTTVAASTMGISALSVISLRRNGISTTSAIPTAMMRSVGDLRVTILPSTRIKNDVDLLRLTFLDRVEAGIPVVAEVQGFCTLIQGPHLFIPLGEAALPHHLARIFSRDSAIGVPNLDAHAHDADVRTAEGEHVTLDGEKGPIIRGATAGDN